MLSFAGIQDLKDRVIATPLPPLSTFLDDPLRVLRAVRFGNHLDKADVGGNTRLSGSQCSLPSACKVHGLYVVTLLPSFDPFFYGFM